MELFERVLSVDAVQRFKPAPETYAHAASELHVKPGDMVMVASHPWDLQGAMHAGMRSAFLNRKGTAWFQHDSNPDFIARDLAQLTEKFLLAF